jgi:hypothetical protein
MAASSDCDVARLVRLLSQEKDPIARQLARDLREDMFLNNLYRSSWLKYAERMIEDEDEDHDIAEMLLSACRSLGAFCLRPVG